MNSNGRTLSHDPPAPLGPYVSQAFRELASSACDEDWYLSATRRLALTASPAASVDHHNRVLAAAMKRAKLLEGKVAALIKPVLVGAGNEAAANFERRATSHFAASADWTPPAGDELLDLAALVASLRGKTDPVRRAVVESVGRAALDGLGIAFDVTNPYAARVLEKSASHLTSVAETTRANVAAIVGKAYQEGFSIPDTAKAIQAAMQGSAGWRARLIARSELASVANGAALAGTQMAAAATGVGFRKVWLTAAGAPHPRHELVDGLDGQVRNLDEAFDVSGSALQYPGPRRRG